MATSTKSKDAAVKAELADKVEANTKPKATRTQLTPEQRIAKAEAELAALREKAEAKANKQKAAATEKRDALVAKRDALNVQIDELTFVIGDGNTEATVS